MSESSLFLSPADSAETENIIAELKKGKASGPYSIPGHFLKMLSHVLAPCLEILINESFTTGIVHDKLKVAKVIALHKKGDSDNPSNYKPISLLSIFYNFLEINEILHPLQFGFRSKHYTSHTLISMTETIRKTIDGGNYGCGIFTDLKKSFSHS